MPLANRSEVFVPPVLEPLEPRLLLDAQSPAVEMFALSPALFAANEGQWADASVRYAFQREGAAVAFTDAGPVFTLYSAVDGGQADAPDPASPLGGEAQAPRAYQSTTFRTVFEGANAVTPIALDRAETVFNYFVGDPANWRSEVPAWSTVAYMNLWDGIDLYLSGGQSNLKYEFHVAPGADWRRIAVTYEGIDSLALDGRGELVVSTPAGPMTDSAPVLYQTIDGARVGVAGCFALVDGDTWTFDVGAYDSSRELVIDPDLAWSTYLGGTSDDRSYGVAADASGNALVTGFTTSSGWASGGFDTSYNTGTDAFVAKISASGAHVWSTYLGGSGFDFGYGIAVDSLDNALVTGHTASSGWTSGGFDTSFNGSYDGFVVKLSASGAHAWSTYLGGNSDDRGYGIAVDSLDNVLVTGHTASSGWVSGGFDTSYNGAYDVFVVKVSASGAHVWSTYLGGGSEDRVGGVAVDASDNALVTGWTDSSGWVSGGFDTSYNGGTDAFVAQISASGAHVWSTYLGGSATDAGQGIAVDAWDNALVTGWTDSADWVSGGFDTSFNGAYDVFVVKLSTSGAHLWSTYLGGGSDDRVGSVAVDGSDNALVTGWTDSADWVSDGFDTSYNGGTDAFVAQISASGAHVWSTYLGGGSEDRGYGIAVDAWDNALVTGWTGSSGWTSGGFDTSYNGPMDGFVAKIGAPVASGPDLTCGITTYEAGTYAPGDSWGGASWIQNLGDAFAPGTFYVDAYLSLDRTFDSGTDVRVYRQAVDAGLAAGMRVPAAGSDPYTATVPDGTAAGRYYVLLVIDSTNVVTESSESNNVWAGLDSDIVVAAPGDATRDGKVDGADLALWQQHYDPLGKNPGNCWGWGDFNGDGRINGGDRALWQQNYNPLGIISTTAAGVPAEVKASAEDDIVIDDPVGAMELATDFVIDDPSGAVELTPDPALEEVGDLGATGALSQPVSLAEPVPGTSLEPGSVMPGEEVVTIEQAGAPELLLLDVQPVAESAAGSALVPVVTPAPVASSVTLPPETVLVLGDNRVRAYRPAIQAQPSDQSVDDILELAVLNPPL